MLVSNCNRVVVLDCGCSFYFGIYNNNTINRLEVGNLMSNNCTLDWYIIRWHIDTINGEIALITGSIDTPEEEAPEGIDQYHPFLDTKGIFIEIPAGRDTIIYVAELWKFGLNGETYFATPTHCRNWCDVDYIPLEITIIKASCSTNNVVGSLSSYYSYMMQFVGTSVNDKRIQNTNFAINSNTKWLAFYFSGGTVPDIINFYFRDSVVPMPYSSYQIGSSLDLTNGNVTPIQFDSSVIKVIIDLTEGGIREISDSDYVRIEVIGKEGYLTDWTNYIECLPENAFAESCDYFNTNIKAINVSSINIVQPVNCSPTTVSFSTTGNLNAFLTSPLNIYSTIIQSDSTNGGYNWSTGTLSLPFYNSVPFKSSIVRTRGTTYSLVPKRFYYNHNKEKGWFIISFHESVAFKSCRDWYRNIQNYALYRSEPFLVQNEFGEWVPTTPDKVGYYKTLCFFCWGYRRKQDLAALEDPWWGDASGYLPAKNMEVKWHILSPTEFSNEVDTSSKGAELIFTHANFGESFPLPTITPIDGNLDGAVIEKYLYINDPYKPWVDGPDVAPQTTLIVLTGTSGSASITLPGGGTPVTITFNGTLLQTAQDFVGANSSNPDLGTNVILTCTQPGEYVNTMKVTYYKGIETDFESFPEDPAEDPLCNGPIHDTIYNSGYGITGLVNQYNTASYTGHSAAYQGNGVNINGSPVNVAAVNAVVWYFEPSLSYQADVDIKCYFPFKSLNNVCLSAMNDNTGWNLVPLGGNNPYEFVILSIKFIFDDPLCIDRTHYKLYSKIDANGDPLTEENWILIYEQ